MFSQSAAARGVVDALPVEPVDRGTIRIHTPPPRSGGMGDDAQPAGGGVKPLVYLRHHWMSILFFGGLIGSILSFIAWTLVPSKYTTYSLVRVSTDDPWVFTRENPQGRNDFATYLKTQAGVFRSQLVLNAALREPGVADLAMLRSQPDPVRFLEEELLVEYQEGSELIRLKLSGEDPRAIATVVNAVQRVYFREIIEKELTSKKARLRELEDSIQKMQEEIKLKYRQLKDTAAAEGNPNNNVLSNISVQLAAGQLIRIKEVVYKIESDIQSLELEKASLEKRLQNLEAEVAPPSPNVIAQIEQDTLIGPLMARIEHLQKKSSYLSKISGDPNHPDVVALQQQINEINEQREKIKQQRLAEHKQTQLLGAERQLKAAIERCKSNIAALETQKAHTQKALTEYEATLTTRGERSDVPPDFLRVEIQEREKILTSMIDKANLLRLEVKAPPRVTDFQAAAIPQKKEMKKQILATVLAGLFGFGLVGLGLVVHEMRLKRTMSLTDVEGVLLGPILGVIPGSTHRAPDSQTGEQMAESIEKLRIALQHQFADPACMMILLTSALEDEGKAFVAAKLADSLVRANKRTLLVDFDLRTPALHEAYHVSNDAGLSEVIRGETDLAKVVHVTAEGLMVLPAGKWSERLRSTLHPEHIAALFNALREQCDYIIVNTHPVLAVADTTLISRFANMVLLVVEKYTSRLPLITRAQEKIAALNPENFGVVFLGATPEECLN